MEGKGQNNQQASLIDQTNKVKQQIKQGQQPHRKEDVSRQAKRFGGSGYRLQDTKTIQITNRLNNRFRAVISKQITFALFGKRRFKNIVLKSPLNHFHTALVLANIFNTRVPNLDMIIQLKTVKFQQFQSQQDKIGKQLQHSIFYITLTKYATQQHKKSSGYNPGRLQNNIQAPITRIIEQNFRRKNDQRKGGNRNNRKNNKNNDNDRQNYKNNQRGQRQGRPVRRQRDQRQDRPRRVQREDRQRRTEREDRNRNKTYNQNQKQYKETNRQNERHNQYVGKNQERNKNRQPQRYEKDYKRGQQKTRGSRGGQRGRGENRPQIAPHQYRPQHLKRVNEDRGDRRPKRSNRYSEDQD